MNILRSLLLPAALSVAIVAPVAVFAQQAGQPPAGTFGSSAQGQYGGHRHGFMGMLRGVNLSDQQKAQIKQIMQQFRQAHPEGSLTDPQARMQAHQQLRSQIMNVLTPAQRAQVQQNIAQMRQRWQQRDGDGQAPGAQPTSRPRD